VLGEQLSLNDFENEYNNHPAWSDFMQAIKSEDITYPEIADRWYWFTAGYKYLENKLKAEATNWWCNYNG